MRPRLGRPAEALERLAETEVSVRRRRVDLEQLLEGQSGRFELATVEVGPTECLDDRGPAGLEKRRPLEDDRRLGVMAAAEEVMAALEELVRGLALVGRGLVLVAGRTIKVHNPDGRMNCPAGGQSCARQSARMTGRRRGLAVVPGIRPRLAIGRPSISLMSPVKSIGVAPLMYDPTA